MADPSIDYLIGLIKSAVRSSRHHGDTLKIAYRNLGFAREIFKRAGCDESIASIDDPDTEYFESADQYARGRIDFHLWEITFHESQLRNAATELANIKMLLARGDYSEIDVSNIEREIADG